MTDRSLRAGESIELGIGSEDEVRGFGVRFAPFEPGDVWRLRTTNRAYGHQCYAPSGHFQVGDLAHTLASCGDDLVEYRPADAPHALRITAGPGGARLHRRSPGAVAGPHAALGCPRWARGAWLSGSWVGLTAARTLADLDEVNRHECRFVGRLIDAGWYGHDGELFGAAEGFGSLAASIDAHRDAGLDVALWIAPWVPAGSEQWDLFRRRGWLVTDDRDEVLVFGVVGDGSIRGSYVDLSAAEPSQAWSEALAGWRDRGVRAVKLDFGEALPDSARLRGELDPGVGAAVELPEQHGRNLFPLHAQRATATGIGADGFVTSRSGWTGSELLTSNWIGDQSSDRSRFAGLGSTIVGLGSALDTGYRMVGLDVGGYFGQPDTETMVAWQRTAVLFDVGFYHGLGERAPWRLGPEVRAAHDRLLECSALASWAPEDPVLTGLGDDGRRIAQRANGRVVAVADLLQPAAVALPEGRWRDVETSVEHDGDRVVACRGGSVFVRV